jgi:hypothetical protein
MFREGSGVEIAIHRRRERWGICRISGDRQGWVLLEKEVSKVPSHDD